MRVIAVLSGVAATFHALSGFLAIGTEAAVWAAASGVWLLVSFAAHSTYLKERGR